MPGGKADLALSVPYQFPEAIRMREALILAGTLQGKSAREIAKEADCAPQTVHRARKKHSDWLALQKEKHQRTLMREWQDVQDALVVSAKDSDNRNQVGAAKVLVENVLGWGSKGGDHFGDVHFHGDVDMRSVNLEVDPASRLAELRRSIGLR